MSAYFTPQAEIDVEEIGDYIALDDPKRAITFIEEIRQHCERIAEGPMRYVARPDLGEAIRICTHGNYVIVFEPYDDRSSCACFMALGTCRGYSTARDPNVGGCSRLVLACGRFAGIGCAESCFVVPVATDAPRQLIEITICLYPLPLS